MTAVRGVVGHSLQKKFASLRLSLEGARLQPCRNVVKNESRQALGGSAAFKPPTRSEFFSQPTLKLPASSQ